MIAITQNEKETISTKFPKTHIVRTTKNRSKLYRYYMTEDASAMRLLRNLRNQKEYGKGV